MLRPCLGQKVPVNEPILFAPGIVSISNHSSVAISPDGKYFFFNSDGIYWIMQVLLKN
jgi:hypothetical protein